jgi:hypothetical protein
VTRHLVHEMDRPGVWLPLESKNALLSQTFTGLAMYILAEHQEVVSRICKTACSLFMILR